MVSCKKKPPPIGTSCKSTRHRTSIHVSKSNITNYNFFQAQIQAPTYNKATAAPKIPTATPAALTTAFVGAAPLPDETADAVPVEVADLVLEVANFVVPVLVLDPDAAAELPAAELAPPGMLFTTELAIATSTLRTLL